MTDEAMDKADRTPSTPEGAFDLVGAGDRLLAEAGENDADRAARTLTPGKGSVLKQTLLALRSGHDLGEHASPGAATLQVLRGRVTLRWNGEKLSIGEGEWAVIPDADHGLHADEDAVVLLTVARSS